MNDTSIFGCFVSSNIGDQHGSMFRSFIWRENGIDELLKKFNYKDYGNDIVKVLFQFYVNPIPYQIQNLEEIENYRKKEKAIGIPIIINNQNFFDKSEEERMEFIKDTIYKKLDLLKVVIESKKLDTNIITLQQDVHKVLD